MLSSLKLAFDLQGAIQNTMFTAYMFVSALPSVTNDSTINIMPPQSENCSLAHDLIPI
jgi:hypothetical protein